MIKDNVVNERKIFIKCTKIVITVPVAVKDIFLDMDSVLSGLLKKNWRISVQLGFWNPLAITGISILYSLPSYRK